MYESAENIVACCAAVESLGVTARGLFSSGLRYARKHGPAIPIAVAEFLAESVSPSQHPRPNRLINQLLAAGLWTRKGGCVVIADYELQSAVDRPAGRSARQVRDPQSRSRGMPVDTTPVIADDCVIKARGYVPAVPEPPPAISGPLRPARRAQPPVDPDGVPWVPSYAVEACKRAMGPAAVDAIKAEHAAEQAARARADAAAEAIRTASRAQEAKREEARRLLQADGLDNSPLVLPSAMLIGAECIGLPERLPAVQLQVLAREWAMLTPTRREVVDACGWIAKNKPKSAHTWRLAVWAIRKLRAAPTPAPVVDEVAAFISKLTSTSADAACRTNAGSNTHRTAGATLTRGMAGRT